MNPIGMYRKYRHWRRVRQALPYIEVPKSTVLTESVEFDIRVHGGGTRVLIGDDCIVGCNFIFESDQGRVQIGNRCYIGGGTNLIVRSDIIIEDDVTLAWGIYLYTHDSHSLDWRERCKDNAITLDDHRRGIPQEYGKNWDVVKSAPIHIASKVWIGMNVIVLKGVTIGEGAVIGAGSVVTHDVPPWTVAAGNPARVVKRIEHERG